ncbi:hypothetical protein AGMMS50284_5910 [Clostridia bacterium]|nr:hypothetical protein AGMMS50284_5910 [Clostridia bacterium]
MAMLSQFVVIFTVPPSNAENKTLKWSSSNTSVAQVNADGWVHALCTGTSLITAKATDGSGVFATYPFYVIGATGVSVSPSSLTMTKGETKQLDGSVSYFGNYPGYSWSTNNKSVATVDGAGNVKAIAAGTAKITLTSGTLSASCSVTVKAAATGGSSGGNSGNSGGNSGTKPPAGTQPATQKPATETNNSNCPIIIIPGAMGSKLYTHDLGGASVTTLWPPEINELYLLSKMNIDNNDVWSANWPPTDVRKEKEYGTYNTYKELAERLCQKFPNRKIYFYPYDWRRSNTGSALILNKWIDQILKENSQYTKADIVAHSMGGLVAASYYQQYGGEKLRKVITIATPYEGAPKLIDATLDGELLGGVNDYFLKFFGMNRDIKSKFPAVAELTPTTAYHSKNTFFYATKWHFEHGQGTDYNTIHTVYDNYAEMNNSKYDEYRKIIFDNDITNQSINFQNSIKSGSLNTLANFKNSFFAIGTGQKGISRLYFNECKLLQNLQMVKTDKDYYGDGTVPYASATMMGNLNNIWNASERVITVNSDHTDIVKNPTILTGVANILSDSKTY